MGEEAGTIVKHPPHKRYGIEVVNVLTVIFHITVLFTAPKKTEVSTYGDFNTRKPKDHLPAPR